MRTQLRFTGAVGANNLVDKQRPNVAEPKIQVSITPISIENDWGNAVKLRRSSAGDLSTIRTSKVLHLSQILFTV